MNKLEQLIGYTELGFKIFPCWEINENGTCACSAGTDCESPGKHPRVPTWKQVATSDRTQVESWHQYWPTANWAWALEDHWVLDFDPRNGGDEPYDYWEMWAGFEMPPTLEQWTGGGGHHVIFKQPQGYEVRNGKLTLPGFDRPAPGVDVKGLGGYIMLAQSNHISGETYRWKNWGAEILPTPQPVLDNKMLERRSSSGSGSGDGESGYDIFALLDKGVPIGEQNDQLFRFMCALRTRDTPRQAMIEFGLLAMSRFQNEDGKPPWTAERVIDMVDHVRDTYQPGYSEAFEIPAVDDEQMAWARDRITPEIEAAAETHRDDPKEAKQDDWDEQVRKNARGLRLRHEARLMFNTELAAERYRNPADDPETDSLAALEELPPEHDQPLVDSLLQVPHNCVIAAAYKTGKTTMACNLAGALVDGTPFLGFATHFDSVDPHGVVLHINAEMTRDDLVHGYYGKLGIKNKHRIKIMNYRDKSLPLSDDNIRKMFVEWCRDNWIRVVIVDSWRRLCAWSGVNENSNEEVEPFLAKVDEFKREAGIETFIAIAHMGRKEHEEGAEHARGATAFDDWADARWLLTNGGKPNYQRALAVNGRRVEMHETVLEFDSETNRLSLGEGDRQANKESAGLPEVVAIVENNPGITKAKLAEMLRDTGVIKASKASFDAIDRAFKAGLVHYVPGPNRSQQYYPGPDPAKAGATAWAASKAPSWQ